MSSTAAQNLKRILSERPLTHTQLARLILKFEPRLTLEGMRVRISEILSTRSIPPAQSFMWGRIALALQIPLSDLDPDEQWQWFNYQLSPSEYKNTFHL